MKYKSDAERSEQEILRDKFRNEIGDWATGLFRAEFKLANDLAQKVRDALLEIFSNVYLKAEVRRSVAESASPPVGNLTFARPRIPLLADKMSYRRGVLFAGAGMSISAGYPTALLLSEHLCRLAGAPGGGAQALARHRFAEVAAFAKQRLGHDKLLASIQELLDTPQPVGPTEAHLKAVGLFDVIMTTNYDELFEEACRMQGLDFTVRTSSDEFVKDEAGKKTSVMIYKLDGTISRPDTLVLTDDDSIKVARNQLLWNQIQADLASKPVTVVGHSLRDTTSRNLLANRNRDLPGVYVGPMLDPIDQINLDHFRLKGVWADADQFMAALSVLD